MKPPRTHPTAAQRLARRLEADIVSGKIPVGARLPTMASLAEDFDVSPATVQNAFGILRDKGLIRTRQGSGSFVIETKLLNTVHPEQHYRDQKLVAFRPHDHRVPKVSTGEVLENHIAPLRERTDFDGERIDTSLENVALSTLDLQSGASVLWRREILFDADRTLVELKTSIIPMRVVDGFPEQRDRYLRDEIRVMQLLAELGIEVTNVQNRIMARPTYGREAAELGVSDKRGLFVVHEVMRDEDDTPVQFSESLMPFESTALQYNIELPPPGRILADRLNEQET